MPKVIYYSNLFVTAKYWKQLKCPHTGEWLNKLWYIHTTEYYTAVKRTKEDLHELIPGDLQNMLSGNKKKSKLQKSINVTSCIREKGEQ